MMDNELLIKILAKQEVLEHLECAGKDPAHSYSGCSGGRTSGPEGLGQGISGIQASASGEQQCAGN
jgi:hypothetical protein